MKEIEGEKHPPIVKTENKWRTTTIYERIWNDLTVFFGMSLEYPSFLAMRSLDELLERDEKRAKDGFPKKIRVGRMIRPGKGGKDKIVVVPTTVEEKFMHDPDLTKNEEDQEATGTGDGEEGDVIGEQPIHGKQESGTGSGQGDGGEHEVESNAYDLGKVLSERFELPNLKDKQKKVPSSRYTYDLTDIFKGAGQVLDKKRTLKKIVETNIHLGNIPDPGNIDPSKFLVSPGDKIYRVLSREKMYESQAMIFFLRDYSGSMHGKATELVVAQHVMIYSWLLYQYNKRAETRFILHDTEAKEVPDFHTYYNSQVAGGTKVASAYRLVNKIIEEENLERDYSIYIFHGTDGDDWDTEGKETIPEMKKLFWKDISRFGMSIVEHNTKETGKTEVEKYVKKAKLVTRYKKVFRMDSMTTEADEPRLIEGIKKLVAP